MIPSVSDKKPIFQGHNLPQVAHYHLHVQGQYQGGRESNKVWEQEMMFSQLVKRSPWWAPDNLLQ